MSASVSTTVEAGGLAFDVDDTGGDGEVVVLLHGFPQTRSMWAPLTPPLAEAGYRVLAPDQRGYSPGARPRRRRDYALQLLAADVIEIAHALGVDRFHVVGHDWGGAVAWQLGADHPDRLRSLTVLSTPHPTAMLRSLTRSLQLLHSWYMLAFQPPLLPERFLSSGVGRRSLRKSLTSTGMSAQRVEESLALLSGPAATATLNWYRALPFGAMRGSGTVTVPTLYVHGAEDFALGSVAARLTAELVSGPYRFESMSGAGHWLLDDDAPAVTGMVLEHLSTSRRPRESPQRWRGSPTTAASASSTWPPPPHRR